ncbi:hypothetical protein AMECASPLE_026000, partial [Ameca splendens]
GRGRKRPNKHDAKPKVETTKQKLTQNHKLSPKMSYSDRKPISDKKCEMLFLCTGVNRDIILLRAWLSVSTLIHPKDVL